MPTYKVSLTPSAMREVESGGNTNPIYVQDCADEQAAFAKLKSMKGGVDQVFALSQSTKHDPWLVFENLKFEIES